MQSSLGNECVVILFGETPCPMQGTCNDTYGLELSTRVANGVFVNRKCLSKELIAELFKTSLIGHFTAHNEQAQRQVGGAGIYTLVEVVDTLMHEPVEC